MPAVTIEFERNELRALKAKAARQLRTPENLARFLILKQMGFILDDQAETDQEQPSNTEELALAL